MAPWPEPDTEPKAPDKGSVSVSEDKDKQPEASSDMLRSETLDEGDAIASIKQLDDRNPGVSELDDIQLRKLLDEAITYKRPKDREGKSELFRELLQEAEADETKHPNSQRGGSVGSGANGKYRRGASRKGDVSERNSRGGSLQNLVLSTDLDVHAGLSSNRKRGGRRNLQPQVSVSARQREGGSLPSNVNADYYTAAALLRSHDDIGTSGGATKRRDQHTTPIDDVVTGNSYSYKLGGAKCHSGAVDDLSGYRVSSSGKQAAGSVDDIVTAAPSRTGSKRRELKKLGHSSDDIYSGACAADDRHSIEDFRKEAEFCRLDDLQNDNVSLCSPYKSEYFGRVPSNVDNGRLDNASVDVDSKSRRNCPSMLGLGLNGTVRPGPDRRWTKSESRKDDDLDGTEMMPIDRSSDILKFLNRQSDHNGAMEEVDQPIESLLRKRHMSNGENSLQLPSTYRAVESLVGPPHDLSAGDSVRGLMDDATLSSNRSRPTHVRQPQYYTSVQISQLGKDKDMRFLRVETGLPNLHRIIGNAKESEKKSYDENGNALHQLHGSGSERKFKARKNKTDNNTIMSQTIPGHRGDIEDINVLLQFIESNSQDSKSSVSGKNNRNTNGAVAVKDSKHRNSSSSGKREEGTAQRAKGDKRKSSDKNKLQKSNSLEEISRTKLSDLTASDNISSKGIERRPKKQSTLDDADLTSNSPDVSMKSVRTAGSSGSGSDRRSWGPEESSNASEEEILRSRKQKESDHDNRDRGSGSSSRQPKELSHTEQVDGRGASAAQDSTLVDPAEFHVVTKKQRKKKTGRSSSIGRNERNQHYAQSNNYHIRESQTRRNATVDNGDSGMMGQYRGVSYRSESPEHTQHHRRKSTSSMPPSDKSADSSDLDSVHSLPISSTTPRSVVDKTSTSSGSTPQASYADIARMASAMSPPQGLTSSGCNLTQSVTQGLSQGLTVNKWPSVGQARPTPPLWTANVTLHTNTPLPLPLPPSQEEVHDETVSSPSSSFVTTLSSSISGNAAKRDAMTNTVSLSESELTEKAPVGNLLSDNSYPPLCDSGKPNQTVTQSVKTFISQASRTSPALSYGVTMASCVDVEDSAKRAASPAMDSARTSAADRPAVIILDETEAGTFVDGDSELTFGFEINEMLLSGTCTVSSEEDDDVRPNQSPAAKPPQVAAITNINLDKIVAFVGRAWEDIMKELPREAGRVQFYSGQ